MKEDNYFVKDNKFIDLNKIVIFVIGVIIIINLINKYLYSKDKEENILKEYKDMIITIVYLSNLKDLINIAINNNITIFNYQNDYYIIKDNIYYIYIINNKKDRN